MRELGGKEKQKQQVKVTLVDEEIKAFYALKELLGTRHNSEVLRMSINNFYRQLKRGASSE